MKAIRNSAAGESRICPHCKATILKSAPSCPICQHVLRFVPIGAGSPQHATKSPLVVEGTIEHPGDGGMLEYSVLMEIHDETGKVVSRSTMGVGALRPAETRTFSLRVQLSPAVAAS